VAFGTGRRSLLFVDVDDPLIPFGLSPDQFSTYQGAQSRESGASNLRLARLNPEHGRCLGTLSCGLAWATAWEHEANELIAPWPGLPWLPVVAWPESPDVDERDEQVLEPHTLPEYRHAT
jgi:hypothetical protein